MQGHIIVHQSVVGEPTGRDGLCMLSQCMGDDSNVESYELLADQFHTEGAYEINDHFHMRDLDPAPRSLYYFSSNANCCLH